MVIPKVPCSKVFRSSSAIRRLSENKTIQIGLISPHYLQRWVQLVVVLVAHPKGFGGRKGGSGVRQVPLFVEPLQCA